MNLPLSDGRRRPVLVPAPAHDAGPPRASPPRPSSPGPWQPSPRLRPTLRAAWSR
ncbi:hypothetical protein ABMX48_10860 [Streptomyces cavourensis]